MKRHVAPRRLKNCCDNCNKSIVKGDVYYTKRVVYTYGEGKILGVTRRYCAKCNYIKEQHKIRFDKFKPNCHHPLIFEVWDYIPGECVMQPDHDECRICGEWIH